MTKINWGPEIAIFDGKKPAFVADDDVCTVYSSRMWCGIDKPYPAKDWIWYPEVTAIRLPASHWAYSVIEKGFYPWAGGDNAPDDWDGGKVLLKNGFECPGHWVTNWKRGSPSPHGYENEFDIVGYRPREDAPAQTISPDTVTLKTMTEAEWNERFDLVPSTGFRPNFSIGAHFVLRELGLIRDETPLERFARETKVKITDENRAAIEAALKWSAEQ